MKKFLILFLFFLISVANLSAGKVAFAESNEDFYAKITNPNTEFYTTPAEDNFLFEIPYSYFVKVDYAVDNFFKVEYNGIDGYVKKSAVKLMDGTPQTPYAQASFNLFVPYNLHQDASSTSTPLASIDTNSTLHYIGTKSGEQLSSTSNKWYYARLEQNNEILYGYVFSGVTDNLTTIPINSESFNIISEDFLNESSTNISTLSNGTKIILIVAISLPSLMILYFLVKPSKILQTKKRKSKRQSPLKRNDYFEFDESQL